MAVHADCRFPACFTRGDHFGRFAQTVDDIVERSDLFSGWRELGDDGKFVILHSTLVQSFGVVDGVVVRDVDDHGHSVFQHFRAVVFDEDAGRVFFVYLAHRFHCAEDATDGFGDRRGALPLGEVLDVPFSGC